MRDPALSPPDYLDQATATRIVVGICSPCCSPRSTRPWSRPRCRPSGASFGDVGEHVLGRYRLSASATAVTPLYGKLSDIHGRRTMLLIAIGMYVLGSLACALAPSMLALILARAVQGLGGGGLMRSGRPSSAMSRPRASAHATRPIPRPSLSRPWAGRSSAASCRASALVVDFLDEPAALRVRLLLTHNVLRLLPRHDRRHELDVLGAGLMVGAAMALMLALTWGGRRYAWVSPQIVLLLAGSVGTVDAVRVPRRKGSRAVHSALGVARRVVRAATGTAFFGVGSLIALTIFLPLYAQVALGLSVSKSALAIIALQGAATITSVVGGRLIARLARYKRVPTIGRMIAIAALLPLALAPASLSSWAALGLIAVAGFGLGPTFLHHRDGATQSRCISSVSRPAR